MWIASRMLARLRGLFRGDVVSGEIREELEFHVRMRAQDYERAGASPAEAVEQARRRFGSVAVWQDYSYDIRGGGVMETIWQDIRYGVRLLIRQPGFSLVAILTLALGIGMTTAIASVIDAAMLHPLPYRSPGQLAVMHVEVPRADRPGQPSFYGPSLPDLQTIRNTPNAPVQVAMWRGIFRSPIVDGAEPERLRGMEIDEHYLGLFDIAPVAGRAFQSQDVQPGAPLVMMIGYGYWQRRFNGVENVVGQRLKLDNDDYEVIGVLPERFYRETALWVPIRLSGRLAEMRGSGTSTYVRVRDGVAIDEAARKVTEIVARAPTLDKVVAGTRVRLVSMLENDTRGYWTTANILLGAVGLILLIACVNVAGLLLARGATRLHEVAIRASIGAGRRRLIRQLLTESLLLSLIGGTIGVLVAWWALDVLVANIPLPQSVNAPASLNRRVLGFGLSVAVVTGLSFGLLPALRLSRASVTHALARGSRRGGSGLSRRGGQWLIGVEVALALVLATGAGLMIRSFGRLVSVDLGFEPGSFITMQASPAELKAAVFRSYYSDLLRTIQQMPGVEHAGAINHLPLMGSAAFTGVTTDTGKSVNVTLRQVLPGYFEAMGLQPVAGRFPESPDLNGGRLVAVVGPKAAKALYPEGSPIGRTIVRELGPYSQSAEIVGIAPELKVDGAVSRREYVELFMTYAPQDQVATPTFRPSPPETMVLVIRPRADAKGLPERLRQAAFAVGPRAVVERVRSGSDWLSDTVVTPRRRTVLLGLLGGLGLLVTLIGVFGMTAYAVARRTQEIGVRMAFGARPADVVRTMVADATWPVMLGITAGLIGAWFATRVISTFLFETTPTDLPTFGAAAFALAATALVAIWIPARKAARVDPVRSLRAE